jgi:hypothetical protein
MRISLANSGFDVDGEGVYEKVASIIRDTLLSPTADRNSWFKYLQRAVLLGGARWTGKRGIEQALFSHTGLHPLMFDGKKQLRVPTAAGLLKDPAAWWASPANVVPGLDLTLKTQERPAIQRDHYQQSIGSFDLEEWLKEYAAWKQADFTAWHQTAASQANWPQGWTSSNRPGLQLIDASLGNLAGIYRNAGFTEGGPCTAWEYGVNYGDLYSSSTYTQHASQEAFGTFLRSQHKIKYSYNGHFTEPKNSIPLQWKMGAKGVIVHNFDLSKADVTSWSAYAKLDASTPAQAISINYRWDKRVSAFSRVKSPEERGSLVGKTWTVTNAAGLKGACDPAATGDEKELGFKYIPFVSVAEFPAPWVAYVQDHQADGVVLKLVEKKGFAPGNSAHYCLVKTDNAATRLAPFGLPA